MTPPSNSSSTSAQPSAGSKGGRVASSLKGGSLSSSPLVVRQRAAQSSSGSSKLGESTLTASAVGSRSNASMPLYTSGSQDGSGASTSHFPQRSPVAGSKGKERARDNELLSSAQYEAAYRSACWPPPRADGDQEWGLSSVPQDGANPDLESRLANFHSLKSSGTHFNSSLMRSHAFHNPHIYAKLVSFVDIVETGSNYKFLTRPGAWDSHDAKLLKLGDARSIAEEQKRITEEKQAAQAPGKRSQISFTSSASSTSRSTARAADTHRQSSSASAAAKPRERQQSVRNRDSDRERDYYTREREHDPELGNKDRLREKDKGRAQP
ncbi:hypothetical protein CF319_g3932 [Tilletia indica]|nr:hypothetical protein CF319_g3932 [Tilletia indica]